MTKKPKFNLLVYSQRVVPTRTPVPISIPDGWKQKGKKKRSNILIASRKRKGLQEEDNSRSSVITVFRTFEVRIQ